MFDEKTEELLAHWYNHFSQDHDEQKRLMLSLLPTDDDNLIGEWYQQFENGHHRLKSDLLGSLPGLPSGVSAFEDEAMDESAILRWFEQFESDHDAQRDALLRKLPSSQTKVIPKSVPPIKSGAVRSKKSWVSNRWLQLAASLLLLVTAGIFIADLSVRPAYAFESVVDRLTSAQRIYFSGTDFFYREDDEPEKFHSYVERPNTFWRTYVLGKIDSKTKRRTHRSPGYRASNGNVLVQEFYPHTGDLPPFDSATSYTVPDHPVWSQIEVEHELSRLLGSLVGDLAREFKFMGRATYNSVPCNLYEQTTPYRKLRVYAALDSPIPLAAVHLMRLYRKGGTPETDKWIKVVEIDNIQLDPASIPADARFPSDDDVSGNFLPLVDRFRGSRVLESQPWDFHIPFRLQSNSGVVVCWGKKNAELIDERQKEIYKDVILHDPEFSIVDASASTIASRSIDLGTTNDGTTTWHWVHVIPQVSNEPSRRVRYEFTRSDFESSFDGVRPSLDIGLEGIRAAIRTAASDDESANAAWERLRASDTPMSEPQA